MWGFSVRVSDHHHVRCGNAVANLGPVEAETCKESSVPGVEHQARSLSATASPMRMVS